MSKGPVETKYLQAYGELDRAKEALRKAKIKVAELTLPAFTEATGLAVGDEVDLEVRGKTQRMKFAGLDLTYENQDVRSYWLRAYPRNKDGSFSLKMVNIYNGWHRAAAVKAKP